MVININTGKDDKDITFEEPKNSNLFIPPQPVPYKIKKKERKDGIMGILESLKKIIDSGMRL